MWFQRGIVGLIVFLPSLVLSLWLFLKFASFLRPDTNLTGASATQPDLGILYINRDSRSDRRRIIEAELTRASLVGRRVQAVEVFENKSMLSKCWDGGSKKCAGQLGCQLSHIQAIRFAIREGWSRLVVFEDDFRWLNHTDPSIFSSLVSWLDEAAPDWDVFAVSLNVIEEEVVSPQKRVNVGQTWSQLTRISKALATHGYMLKSNMFDRVLFAFENCDIRGDLWTAIDTCWQPLQLSHKWYGLQPQLGTQAPGFSDIENQPVSYGID